MKRILQISLVLALYGTTGCTNQSSNVTSSAGKITDPLPSWNDGATKRSIIAYVQRVTDTGSPELIPAADRIATFDNDGTLWAEHPFVQELFSYYMVKKMVAAKPVRAQQQPFKAVIGHDKSYFEKGGEKAMLQLLMATHTGMSQDSFDAAVHDFFATAVYPGKNIPVTHIVYQPQLELLSYLRAHGFKVYICTGGTVDFVRGIAPKIYGIPEEQVIGSRFKYVFADSSRTLLRQPVIELFNDKSNKPVGIHEIIGKKPVFACGNEGGAGDIAMLQYSQTSPYRSFQLVVNHNDSLREFYYQEPDNATLRAAETNNWHVIDMQQDWKKIFPGQ